MTPGGSEDDGGVTALPAGTLAPPARLAGACKPIRFGIRECKLPLKVSRQLPSANVLSNYCGTSDSDAKWNTIYLHAGGGFQRKCPNILAKIIAF